MIMPSHIIRGGIGKGEPDFFDNVVDNIFKQYGLISEDYFNDFYPMVSGTNEYGGFWVSRYNASSLEVTKTKDGYDVGNIQFIQGKTASISSPWPAFVVGCKNYSSNEVVKSCMIPWSYWERTVDFCNSESYPALTKNMTKGHNGDYDFNNSAINGAASKDKIKNIYDVRGGPIMLSLGRREETVNSNKPKSVIYKTGYSANDYGINGSQYAASQFGSKVCMDLSNNSTRLILYADIK